MSEITMPASERDPKPNQKILSVDFDGTLAAIFKTETGKKIHPQCAQWNQWSIPCWLAKMDPTNSTLREKAQAYGTFQDAMIKWAYTEGFEDTPLEIGDRETMTQAQIAVLEILEEAQVLYEALKGSIKLSNWSEHVLQAISPYDFKHIFGNKTMHSIYIHHLKNAIWLLATFELWRKLSITTEQLEEYGLLLGERLNPTLLEQIVLTLKSGDNVVINTFGVEEITMTALICGLKQKFIGDDMSEEEAEGFIDTLIAGGKLSTTEESYSEYQKIAAQAQKYKKSALELITEVLNGTANVGDEELIRTIECYIYSKILPFHACGPMMATGVGKVFRLLEELTDDTSVVAMGDSNTYDGPMARTAALVAGGKGQILNTPYTMTID